MPIEFKPIATPDFSKTLEALNKAGDDYKDVFKGLQTTLDGIQTNVVNRNNATLQDYINKAATPEELQGTDFQVGLQNLKESMNKNFSPLDVNKYADTRVDTLRQRANDIFNAQKAQAEYGQLQKDWRTKDASQNAAMALLADPAVTQEQVMGQFPDADPVIVSTFANNLLKSRNEARDRAANIYMQNNPGKALPPELQGADASVSMKLIGELEAQRAQARASDAAAAKSEVDAAGQRIVNANQREMTKRMFGDGQPATSSLGNINLGNITVDPQLRSGLELKLKKKANFITSIAPTVAQASREQNVPIALTWAMMAAESGFDPNARSPAGAQGLMQFMPATAKRFKVDNPDDPVQAITGATKYISFLLKRYDGDVKLAIAGYNAGEGRVDKAGRKVPKVKETKDYVNKVFQYLKYFGEQTGELSTTGGSMPMDPRGFGIGPNGNIIYSPLTSGGRGSSGGGSDGGGSDGSGGGSGSSYRVGSKPWSATTEGLLASYPKELATLKIKAAGFNAQAAYPTKYKSMADLKEGYRNLKLGDSSKIVLGLLNNAQNLPEFNQLPVVDQVGIIDNLASQVGSSNFLGTADFYERGAGDKEYTAYVKNAIADRNRIVGLQSTAALKELNRQFIYQIAQSEQITPIEAGRALNMSDDTLKAAGVMDEKGNPIEDTGPTTTSSGGSNPITDSATQGVQNILNSGGTSSAPSTQIPNKPGTQPAPALETPKQAVTKDALGYYRGSSLTTDQMKANANLMQKRQNQLLKGNFEGEPGLAKDIAALDAKIASLKKQPGTANQISELQVVRKNRIQRTYDGLQIERTSVNTELGNALKSKRDAEAKKLQDKLDAENANIERIKVASKTPADKPLPSTAKPSATPSGRKLLSDEELKSYAAGKKRTVFAPQGEKAPWAFYGETARQYEEATAIAENLKKLGRDADAEKVLANRDARLNATYRKDSAIQKAAQEALRAKEFAADAAGEAVKANTWVRKSKEADEYMKKQGLK